jgi:DNA-directed RNA polymerase specialized sigma24 family protein
VAQETWLRLRAEFDGFRGAAAPADTAACLQAWLRQVARRVAPDLARKLAWPAVGPPSAGPAPADPSPSAGAAWAEWTSRLEAVLGREEQLIVRRNVLEGVSLRQIATELGLPDHTAVGRWRNDILARLRTELEGFR